MHIITHPASAVLALSVARTLALQDMEAECFGGQETSQYSTYPRNPQHGGGGNGSNWRRERTRNAFLLVYDRQALPSAACSHSQPQQQLQERQDDPRVSELEQQLAATSMSSASSSSRCVSPPPPPPPPKLRPSPSGEQNTTVGGISAGGGQNSDGRADGAGVVKAAPVASAGWGLKSGVVVGEAAKGRNDEGGSNAAATEAMATGVRPRRRRQRRKRFRAEVPEVFLEQIWRENVEFWRWCFCAGTMFFCSCWVCSSACGAHVVGSCYLGCRQRTGAFFVSLDTSSAMNCVRLVAGWRERPRDCFYPGVSTLVPVCCVLYVVCARGVRNETPSSTGDSASSVLCSRGQRRCWLT